jgi:hypothetical protein
MSIRFFSATKLKHLACETIYRYINYEVIYIDIYYILYCIVLGEFRLHSVTLGYIRLHSVTKQPNKLITLTFLSAKIIQKTHHL